MPEAFISTKRGNFLFGPGCTFVLVMQLNGVHIFSGLKRILLFLAFSATVLCSRAQQTVQQKRDSLINLLTKAKPDTNKVKLLNKIGDEYAYSDFKTATSWYEQGFELSKKLDFTRGIIRYYSSQGEILNMNGEYASCLQLLQKGMALSIERKDKMRQGIMAENIGNTYALMEKLDSATNYYYQSLGIFESFKDTVKIANVYSDLSSIYMRTQSLQKALEYADKGLAILQNNKDGFYLATMVNKEAILWKLKRFAEAESINNEIEKLAIEQQDDLALCNVLQNKCSHTADLQQYASLLNEAPRYFAAAQKLDSREQLIIAGYWMAAAHYYNGNWAMAEQYLQEAAGKAAADSNALRLKQCYLLYAKLMLANGGKVALADAYQQKADSIEQLTLNEDILKATHNAEQKYETAKMEDKIRSQSSELQDKKKLNNILIVLSGVLLAALLFFGLWMRNRQKLLQQQKLLQAQQIEQLQNEKQLTATQAVLRGQEEERSRLAKDLHDGLGGILSSAKYSFNSMKQHFILSEENAKAFEKSMNMLDESIAELRRVAHNMMPETLMKLSLDEALQDYCMQVTQSGVLPVTYQSFGMEGLAVDNTIKTTVYRIIQELLNNIIKHANAQKAIVQLIAKDQILDVTVEDDGQGFDITLLERAAGIGFKNTRSRVSFLKGTLDIQSKRNEGTSVYIEIPLQA